MEYRKGQTIYNQDQPSTNLYLVIEGKVKVIRLADDGHQVVVDIYQPDEFFGESAFLSLPHRSEQATALEDAKLMAWGTQEIEDIIMKRPRLAVALLQIQVQRTLDMTQRIESFSADNIARRLARSLIRFSERLGTVETDGSVRMSRIHARVAVAVCGNVARDRDPLHESIPPHGLPAILAPGYRDVPRCAAAVVAAERVRDTPVTWASSSGPVPAQ